jgi:dUTP pyrophosphatase
MFVFVDADEDLVPTYALDGDAGADLRANADYFLPAGFRELISTGVRLQLPKNMVALVHPRSGLALNHGITVLNAPGTIDSNYRGEVGVILINTSNENFHIKRGDRIAQLVFQEVVTAQFVKSDELSETERGESGFGSTGAN